MRPQRGWRQSTWHFLRYVWTSGRVGKAVLIIGSLAFVGLCQALASGSGGSVSSAGGATPTQGVLLLPTKTVLQTGAALPNTPVPFLPATPSLDPSHYPTQPPNLIQGTVSRVVDGDTIDVRLPGGTERIRLIGIDTPETVHPSKPVQCFGREASAHATALLDQQTVWIETDPSQDTRDIYGRLLGYVWYGSGRLFNLDMIADGYANEYTYRKPYRYQASFKQAAQTAAREQRGLWSPTTCNGDTEQPAAAATFPTVPPIGTSLPSPRLTPTALRTTNGTWQPSTCDPSYPTVCIPPRPPDLNCADIPFRRFEALPADPHNFDGDGDGIGCER